MAHKAVAVHHDGSDDREVEYQNEEQAILAAVQFAHAAGVKRTHVLDDNGKEVWNSESGPKTPADESQRRVPAPSNPEKK